jgi:Ca2+-binding RTX toxin-like protein
MANTIVGGVDDDNLIGTDLEDVLIGGQGNDYLYGGAGDDSYEFSIGDGQDSYYDTQGLNKIIFKDLKSTDDFYVSGLAYGGLKISYGEHDSLTLFSVNYGTQYQPSEYQFSDGIVLSHSQLIQRAQISFVGTDQDDYLYGTSSGDVINGGKGNDGLNGGEGDDTYELIKGDGKDTYYDEKGSNKLVFKDVKSTEIIGISGLVNGGLKVQYGQNDEIALLYVNYDARYHPSEYQFSDGIVLSHSQLIQRAQISFVGTDQDDNLHGTSSGDVINGGKGDDQLYGREGDDIYKFNIGDGVDVINDYSGINYIVFNDLVYSEIKGIVALNNSVGIRYGEGDIVAIDGVESSFLFADGQVLTLDDIMLGRSVFFDGTEGGDNYTGTIYSDVINGGKGDDVLAGDAFWNNTLSKAVDTFVFEKGDGHDTVSDYSGLSILQFLEMESHQDWQISLSEQGLMIKYSAEDSVLLRDFVSGYTNFKISVGSEVLSIKDLLSQHQISGGVNLVRDDYNNTIHATMLNDHIEGLGGADDIYAGGGDDVIVGGTGHDKLFGDVGGTEVAGDGGHDIYQFSVGDGIDDIYDNQGSNTIRWTNVASTEVMTLEHGDYGFSDGSLIIHYGQSDRIEMREFFYEQHLKNFNFEFSDGVVLSSQELLTKYQISIEQGQTIQGTALADQLYGAGGADHIAGGRGDDLLVGSYADDHYLFQVGDGHDVIEDGHGLNTIEFEGIDLNDLELSWQGVDLILSYGSDLVEIKDFAGSSQNPSFKIIGGRSENVQVWNREELLRFSGIQYWLQALDDLSWGLGGVADYDQDGQLNYIFLNQNTSGSAGWSEFSDQQELIAVDVISELESFSGLKFTEVFETQQTDLFTFENDQNVLDGASGVGGPTGWGGGVVILRNQAMTYRGLIAHELGHALGLRHPFAHPQVGDDRGRDGDYLFNPIEENTAWTIMSYSGGQSISLYSPFDIATLQAMYGVNPNVRAGDDTYTFDDSVGVLIWDGAGIDQIDGSQAEQRVTIDLREGGWSFIGEKAKYISTPEQLAINRNTQIEHASGSMFDDKLLGNTTHNTLKGLAGKDIIYGYQGDDELHGEVGADQLYGGSGQDRLYGGSSDDQLWGGIANDQLFGASGGDLLYGGDGDDAFFAGSGHDVMYGDAGDDVFYGDSGQDRLYGGLGSDTLNAGSKADYAYGAAGDDQLYGSSGADVLDGGGANDLIAGGSGNDQLLGNSGQDHLMGHSGEDTLIGASGADQLDGGSDDDELLGGSGADHIVGGSGKDRLYGGSGSDILDGGTGSDKLSGGASTDTYLFQRGYRTDSIIEIDQDEDYLVFGDSIRHDQLWFSQVDQDLQIYVIGTENDMIVVKDWFVHRNHQIEHLQSGDGKNLSYLDVHVLVDAMASLTPPVFGEVELDADYKQHLQLALSVWLS